MKFDTSKLILITQVTSLRIRKTYLSIFQEYIYEERRERRRKKKVSIWKVQKQRNIRLNPLMEEPSHQQAKRTGIMR